MKRLIAILVLVGVAAFGLSACLHEDGTATGNEDTTVAAVENTEDVADVDTESADAPETTGDSETDEPPVVANEDTAEGEDGNTRGPISILGNADFTSENGVLGGSGTEDDPYVIAGWQIVVPAGEYYGVRIENVTVQFALRGLSIQNATELNGAGIRIGFASGGAIEGCVVANSAHGISIISSTDISIENCVLYVTGRGLQVIGETEEQYRHVIADSNSYNDRPIYYFYGLNGDTISGLKGGHLTVAGSRNVTISNNEVVNGDGLLLAFVEDSTVTANVVHRTANVPTYNGIHLYESHRNEVSDNLLKNNRAAAIQLTLANSNKIFDNRIYSNDTGVRLLASEDNEIRSNQVLGNVTGIRLLGGASDNSVIENIIGDDRGNMTRGIQLETSLNNDVERNLVFGAETGIALDAQALANDVVDNTVVSGGYGIYLEGSNNTIERNLLSQFSRAILFPETFQRSITRGNTFRGNVVADNGNHVNTNMDSTSNWFTENVFLNEGRDMVIDQGDGNLWMKDGVGNFWGFRSVSDADGDGIGDSPMTVYPSEVDDTAPLATIDARQLGLGIVGTLELGVTTIEPRRGDTIHVPAYVADDDHERATGFRGFPTELIAGFPGILFIFEAEVENGFTMFTVPFDLDIAFFNAQGVWVGGTTMTAQAADVYQASSPYQYALELPSGSLEELGIGSGSKLVLP